MTTVFHKTKISKEKLRDIIARNPKSLIDGLNFIDFQLEVDAQGVIEFLGVDGKGRLVIINFNVMSEDGMLISALSQMHWLEKNNALIKRLFFSENIDFSLGPQILLVASEFSSQLKSAAKQVKTLDIKLVEFKYITAHGKDAIIFEEVFPGDDALLLEEANIENEQTSKHTESLIEDKVSQAVSDESFQEQVKNVKTPDLILKDVSLSQEEIAEFRDFEKMLEEKKIAA